jgi:hypothetical protein
MPVLRSSPVDGSPESKKRRKEKRPIADDVGTLHGNDTPEPGTPVPSSAQAPHNPPEKDPPQQVAPPEDISVASESNEQTTAPSSQIQEKQNNASSISASPTGGVIVVDGVEFHHASEAEFARLLSYYGIEWQYEPNQFPLRWQEGRPVEMFSPDFYLTEYDLYIELTTMRQSLVRRKNRKLRLLRALYPEINIKLLYRRDYQRLLERFGIKPEEIEAEMPPGQEADTEE